MAEGMRISIPGGADVLARLEGRRAAVVKGFSRSMQKALDIAYRRVQDNLHGRVLRVKNSRLSQSIQTAVEQDGQLGRIGTNVEYAAIHEYGGTTKPHPIVARRAKALAFQAPGFIGPIRLTAKGKIRKTGQTPGSVFIGRAVKHPGSTMPARPWLRPALRDSMPEINELFRAGLAAALGKP